jgi:hypothetical protein
MTTRIGHEVTLCTYGIEVKKGKIVNYPVASGINNLTCYEVEFTDGKKALFYMKPELGTNKHLNVGNKAFWITLPSFFTLN